MKLRLSPHNPGDHFGDHFCNILKGLAGWGVFTKAQWPGLTGAQSLSERFGVALFAPAVAVFSDLPPREMRRRHLGRAPLPSGQGGDLLHQPVVACYDRNPGHLAIAICPDVGMQK